MPEDDDQQATPSDFAVDPTLQDFRRFSAFRLSRLEVAVDGVWRPIGPEPQTHSQTGSIGSGPVSGLVTSIAIDPKNEDIIYLGTSNGGVWKSINRGINWKPTMELLPSLAIGAVAVDPGDSSIVYAGSGYTFTQTIFGAGAGIYKSVDGGGTWSILDGGLIGNPFSGVRINRMACPAPGVLLVATSVGLFQSMNGGLNFGAEAPAFADNEPVRDGIITDLIVDNVSPDRGFVCVAGEGIFPYRTLANGMLVFLEERLGFDRRSHSPTPPFGDIVLAQSRVPDNQTLYASVQVNAPPGPRAPQGPPVPTYLGLFKSEDGGNIWRELPQARQRAAIDGFGQTNYDLTVGVDPQDARRVYVGFQELWRSTDGEHFEAAPCTRNQVHFDHHAIVFTPNPLLPTVASPAPPTNLYVGTDGGFALSVDGGTTWTSPNEDLATHLVFSIGIGHGAGNSQTYAGLQDNGIAGSRPGLPGAHPWFSGLGGDGGVIAVDPDDPATVYSFTTTAGFFVKSRDSGNNWPNVIATNLDIGRDPRGGLRMVLDPSGGSATTRRVYIASARRIFRSTDAGASFRVLNSLTPLVGDSSITALAISSVDPRQIWVGLQNGSLCISVDGGTTWRRTSTQPGPAFPISCIATDPATIGRAAIGLGAVNQNLPLAHSCYVTDNNGDNWTDASGTLNAPNGNLVGVAIESLVLDATTAPSTIIAACEGAVLRSLDSGRSWQTLGVGLPFTWCRSLAFDGTGPARVLRVGTWGRGCYELTRPTGRAIVIAANLGFHESPIGQGTLLPFQIFNAGNASLQVLSINALTGGSDFSLSPAPAFPLTLASGGRIEVPVLFKPTALGIRRATFEIRSDDPTSPQTVFASGECVALPPFGFLAVIANLTFDLVEVGSSRDITIQVFNTGTLPIRVTDFHRIEGSSDYEVFPAPVFPQPPLAGGAEQDFVVRFKPTSNGPLFASFQIMSDTGQKPHTLNAAGRGTAESSSVLTIVLVALGAVLLVGGGILIYEELNHK